MEFLNNLPEWFRIVLISAVTFIIFFAILKGYNFKSKIFSFFKNNSSKEPENSNPHLQCGHVNEVLLSLHSVWDKYEQIKRIEILEPLKTQMNYAEQKADQIVSLLQLRYLKKLQEKKESNKGLVDSYSYKSYRNVLYIVSEELLKIIRHNFKENHFGDMTEIDFNKYKNNKVEEIINKSTELLNIFYFYKEDIIREELYDHNMKSIDQIKNIIRDTFDNARQMAINSNNKINIIKKEISGIFNKFVKN